MPLLCWPRELRVWWYDGQSAGREGERRREGGPRSLNLEQGSESAVRTVKGSLDDLNVRKIGSTSLD